MREAIEQYGDVEAGPEASSVPSGTGSTEMSLDVPETIEEASPPAFLPPSDDVSGSVATSDSKRIWPQNVYVRTCVQSEGEHPRQKLTRKK